MAKLEKNDALPSIDSNISEAFIVIDGYLPKRYTDRVRKIAPEYTKGYIRVVKHERRGPAKLIAALRTVAEEEKQLLS